MKDIIEFNCNVGFYFFLHIT